MTGCWVFESNSVLLASAWPSTSRANSMVAHCMPRQMPKYGMSCKSGETDGLDLALDAPHTEAARHEHAIDAREDLLRTLDGHVLGLDSLDDHPGGMVDARVVERLINRLVGVAVADVLADDRDRHLVLGVDDAVHQVAPVVDVQRAGSSDRGA